MRPNSYWYDKNNNKVLDKILLSFIRSIPPPPPSPPYQKYDHQYNYPLPPLPPPENQMYIPPQRPQGSPPAPIHLHGKRNQGIANMQQLRQKYSRHCLL